MRLLVEYWLTVCVLPATAERELWASPPCATWYPP